MNLFSRFSISLRKPVIKLVAKPTPMTWIGPGQAKNIGNLLAMLKAEKVLVVTDRLLHQIGLLDGMLEGIKSAGIDAVLYDGVQPDPTFAIVDEAQKSYAGCDSIVAVGGGSVIDAAKAVAAAAASGKPAVKLAGILKVGRSLPPFIAVPTTAGTGSETTVAAIISDTRTHSKKQILDPKLVPMIAVLDPELCTGLPAHTTAHTALDALTHALEAYVSGYADQETDRYARIAVKLIFENLPKVKADPGSLKARQALLVASFYAGMAFTRTYVGYVHAFAHTIGGKFGVPHGLANAVLLPHVMEYYLPVCAHRFAELSALAAVCESSDTTEQKAKKFIDSLFLLNRAFEIPERFDKFPSNRIDEVITAAFRECHGIYPVPRYFNRKQARGLMQKISQ